MLPSTLCNFLTGEDVGPRNRLTKHPIRPAEQLPQDPNSPWEICEFIFLKFLQASAVTISEAVRVGLTVPVRQTESFTGDLTVWDCTRRTVPASYEQDR